MQLDIFIGNDTPVGLYLIADGPRRGDKHIHKGCIPILGFAVRTRSVGVFLAGRKKQEAKGQ
jgi:hypothetical protein